MSAEVVVIVLICASGLVGVIVLVALAIKALSRLMSPLDWD